MRFQRNNALGHWCTFYCDRWNRMLFQNAKLYRNSHDHALKLSLWLWIFLKLPRENGLLLLRTLTRSQCWLWVLLEFYVFSKDQHYLQLHNFQYRALRIPQLLIFYLFIKNLLGSRTQVIGSGSTI